MKKLCKKCKKPFKINKIGQTPDTVFCPQCSTEFKRKRVEWDDKVLIYEKTDIIPLIKEEQMERVKLKIHDGV